MRPKIKIELNDLLFFTALFFYLIRTILDASLYDYILPSIWTRVVNGIVLLLLIIKWFVNEKFTVKQLIIWACVFSILLVLAVTNNYLNIFVIFVLIFSAQDINFDNILKCIVINLCILSFFVIGSCGIGVLEDYTYTHDIIPIVSEAHSLGFKYYSTLGYITMTISAIYLYLNRDCGYIKLFLIAVLNTISYFIHTTTLALAFSYIMIVAYTVIIKWKWFRFEKKVWKYIGILAPVVFCSLTIGTVFLYNIEVLNINVPLLRTIVGRLEYSVQAIDEYGIHLLGSHVTMYGNTAVYYGEAESGFYIDSGYMYMFIAYGIVFSLVAIIFYMILAYYIYLCHDPLLYAWYVIVVGLCCINNFMFSLVYNPLLFLMAKALFDTYNNRDINVNKIVNEQPNGTG